MEDIQSGSKKKGKKYINQIRFVRWVYLANCMQFYLFTSCCFVWMLNLVYHPEGRT
jgi:hypothetical protein